jgi:hypothetical protein
LTHSEKCGYPGSFRTPYPEARLGVPLRLRPEREASRPLNTSKIMQPRSATAQSFQEPNHSKSGVPCTSQTISQIRLANFPPPQSARAATLLAGFALMLSLDNAFA